MSNRTEKQQETERARETLRAHLPVGASLSGLVTYVSRSGMSRRVRLLAASNGTVRDWSYTIARATGSRYDERGVEVGGCGFCPVLHVVDYTAHAVHGSGEAWKAVRL